MIYLNKLRYYYQVEPEHVEPVTYKDIFYGIDYWFNVIPNGKNEKGKLQDFWYRDNTITKSMRADLAKAEVKTKDYVITQRFPVTFDIETNNYTERKIRKIGGKEKSFLECCEGYAYHMQILINDTIIHCKAWNEVFDVFNVLVNKLGLGETEKNAKRVCRIWDANLGFEFSFICKHLKWNRVFASRPRKPITAETKNGLFFQDALMISGTSLEKTSLMYKLPTKKTHDLDYNITRISTTKLTNDEIFYTSCDVRILAEFHRYLVKNYIDNGLDIPITKTQMLRDSIKKMFNDTEMYKGHLSFFAKRLKDLHFQTYDEYSEMIRFLFRGGYSHANHIHAEKIIENVFGWDFTSSYPYCMLFLQYPITPFKPLTNVQIDDIINMDKQGYATISKIKFTGLRPKTTHSIESISKTIEYEDAHRESEELKKKKISENWYTIFLEKTEPIIDNGRILAANHLTVWLTEIDLRNYELFYTWEKAEVLECKRAAKGFLPDYVRYPIMVYYEIKSKLKKAGQDDTTAYKLAKEMVNAAYGMMCEKLHLTDYVYAEEKGLWAVINPDEKTVDSDYLKEVFGEKCLQGKTACRNKLPAVWGIYTTALARNNLLTIVANIKEDALYCDTDSVYVKNFKKYKKLIDRYNEKVKKQNRMLIEQWNTDHKNNEKVKPIQGEFFEDLGTFDPIIKGDVYTKFKTLGAKRYLKESKKKGIEQVIAGLPKGKLKEYCEKTNQNPFEVFNNDMCIPNVKKSHCYNDKPHSRILQDIDGNTEEMHELSSCGIFEVDFSLSMSDTYLELIELGIKEKMRKFYKGEYASC